MGTVSDLEKRARAIKLRFLKMYHSANAGHVGSSLSCAEILTFLKLGWMSPNDELVLSKGHAAAALYSVLAETGEITEDVIGTFYKDGTLLSAHPPPGRLPGIPFATGSLGHGLSLAAGMALAAQLKKTSEKVFCVTSDGELNEGSTWEAALFASHHRLNQLHWIIDRNRLQGFGTTEEVMQLEPLQAKLQAFGWEVLEADGHRFESLIELKNAVEDKALSGRPVVAICNTVKGKGLSEHENTVGCHYLPLTEAGYREFATRLLEAEGPNNA